MTPTPLPGPALLFCPADRPDRYAKALAAADGVILDLEDGVGAGAKQAAREALLSTPLDPARVVVRVNPAGRPEHVADLAAADQAGYRTIMLPKAESPGQLEEFDGWQVVALCETPAGIAGAAAIAAVPAVTALMWGAEDLTAALGGRTSRFPGGRYRDFARHARSVTLLAAAAAGKLAVDSVYVNIGDLDGLAAEAEDAVASGFARKAAIHPSQVPVIRAAFRPTDAQVAWARRVLDAVQAGAGTGGTGVIKVDGQMIDAPLIRQAEAILGALG